MLPSDLSPGQGRRTLAAQAPAAPVERDGLPGVVLRRAVTGVHDAVDDVPVVERLLGGATLVDSPEHVAEHVHVAELGDLVADREEPAGRRPPLPGHVAAAPAGPEHPEAVPPE